MQTIPRIMFIFAVTAFDDLKLQQCTSAYLSNQERFTSLLFCTQPISNN